MLIYSNTFNVPFQFDDKQNIAENPIVKDLKYFTRTLSATEFLNHGIIKTRFVGYLSFALNYKMHGLNVAGYHVLNILIHVINALLFYLLVILTFKTPSMKLPSDIYPQLNLTAFFSSLLFVSHPIQTQAVTYIVQRFASLATMFYLLSMVMYVKARLAHRTIEHSPQRSEGRQNFFNLNSVFWYIGAVISAVFAIKTKEIAFTLPFIIILYETCFLSGTQNLRRFLYLLPFIITMLIIPLSLIGTDKPVSDVIGELRDVSQETEKISRWSYLFTQFRVIVTYLRLLALPTGQNLDYDYPRFYSFLNPQVFLSFLFLLSLSGAAIYLFYASRFSNRLLSLASFGIFWFFITLSVESSVIPIRDVIFEHRVYLPSLGVFIAVVTLVFIFTEKFKRKSPLIGKAVISAFVFIVIIFSGLTYARNAVWQDEMSLWEDVVKKSPGKERGHNNLGIAYYKDKGLRDKAIEQYQIALKLKPDYAGAFNNLGNAYKDKGLIDKAIEQYQTALKLQPDYADAFNNLGNAYKDKGLRDKAIEQYQIALKLQPDYADAHNNMGVIYRNKGQIDKAIEQYQAALRLKPDFAEAHNNLGVVYRNKGQIDKAIEQYQIALKLQPDYAVALNNMGNAYKDKGLIDKAIEQYQAALKLKPDFAEAHNNLGIIYTIKGLTGEAIREFKTALEIRPTFTEARQALESLTKRPRGRDSAGNPE